jgi:hypothetical protein
MRYLRMYVVINILMAGAMRAANIEEGVPAGVDEEPPQQIAEPSVDQQPPATEHAAPQASSTEPPTQPVAVEQVPATQAEAVPPAEVAVVEPEPTIEDAEAVFAEEMTNQPQGMPEAPQNVGLVASEPEPPVQGITTVDLEQPQGNWLFKKYWWDRAEETYKKIKNNSDKIGDMRVKFFTRRTELDKTILDPFYADVGLTQSELQRSMQSLMSQLEQERDKEGMLSEEERELMETVKKDRERLEQLDRDIKAVGTLRDEADRAVEKVLEQKKRASQYETEAWDTLREIGRVVNDTKASELFYKMDAALRTVKEVAKYVEQDVNGLFDKLLSNAREQTERIKTALQALKEQGVDLKARVQEAQEHDLARDAAAAEEATEKEKTKAAPEKTGWASRLYQAVIDVTLWQFLQSIWDVIMWLPRRIYSTITSIFR